MMVVMPPLAEPEDPKDEIVSAIVAGPKRLAPPQMTDRVNAPGHMMDQEYPRQAAPQQQATIYPSEAPAPQENNGRYEAQQWQDDSSEIQQAHTRRNLFRVVGVKW